MMRIFTDDGDAIPVTVLDVSNNRVAQIKTEQTEEVAKGGGHEKVTLHSPGNHDFNADAERQLLR